MEHLIEWKLTLEQDGYRRVYFIVKNDELESCVGNFAELIQHAKEPTNMLIELYDGEDEEDF